MDNKSHQELLESIKDLTKIIIALNRDLTTKSEIARRRGSLGMSPTRIALLLELEPKDVTSKLSKAKKATKSKVR